MTYVVAAYLLTLAVLAGYVWTVWVRHRELVRAAGDRQ
ncbi:MAG: heme exporter protein CcmD [bacterium]